MIIFRKARKPQQTLNDLDAYIGGLGYEPIRLLDREVLSWGEVSYDELAQIIESGRYGDWLDFRDRYSKVINEILAPLWVKAIEAASDKATRGQIVLSDSHDEVKEFLRSHGAQLITSLSNETRKAVMNVIYRGIFERTLPKEIARQVRPLIGLTERQAQQNTNYRAKIYQQYLANGASETAARKRADKAAVKYAAKQHRYRAETIVLTETAFAYNHGAGLGVRRAIREHLMPRCEMVWTTAGVLRTCPRCIALNGKVIGTTDESGVQLPPLHPRCRCAIIYREVSNGLAAGKAIYFDEGGKSPYKIGAINFNDAAQVQQVLSWSEARIVTAPVENAIIITRSGEIYHCTGGLNSLDSIAELGDKLIGAIVTHNHPLGSDNEYSFSDADLRLFFKYKLARLRGIDERFIYELNRNPNDIDAVVFISEANEFNTRHGKVVELARELKIGYRRRAR